MPAPIPEKAADTTKSVLMDIPVTFAYNITQDESGGYSIIEDTSKKDSPPPNTAYIWQDQLQYQLCKQPRTGIEISKNIRAICVYNQFGNNGALGNVFDVCPLVPTQYIYMFEGGCADKQLDYYVTLHNTTKDMTIYKCEDKPPYKTTPTTFITKVNTYTDANENLKKSMARESEYMLYNVHNLSGRLLPNPTGLSQLQDTLTNYNTVTKCAVETIKEQLVTYVYRDIGADVMIVHIRHPIDPKVLYTGVVARTEEGARKAYQTYFDIKKGTLTVIVTIGNSKESWGRIARRPIDP